MDWPPKRLGRDSFPIGDILCRPAGLNGVDFDNMQLCSVELVRLYRNVVVAYNEKSSDADPS